WVRLNSVIITFSGFKSGTCQRYSGRVKSMNIDYVVEAYAAGCLLENITLGDFTAPAAPESGA
ncbi:hypothetical protein B1R83_01995, partial [Salmonella enterica subsp. enterica serovar Weltevreden]